MRFMPIILFLSSLLGVKSCLFPLTPPTLFMPTLKLFWYSSTILAKKYDFRYKKGMFHALTYLC